MVKKDQLPNCMAMPIDLRPGLYVAAECIITHNYDVQYVESIREVGLKKTNALLG